MGLDSGSVTTHVDFDEDLRSDGGIVVDGGDTGELVGVIDHEDEAIWSEGFGDEGEAVYCCWSYGEAVEKLEGVRIGQEWDREAYADCSTCSFAF